MKIMMDEVRSEFLIPVTSKQMDILIFIIRFCDDGDIKEYLSKGEKITFETVRRKLMRILELTKGGAG